MADYLVTGKKGNGKSLVCVGRMRDALLSGRPIATNLDLKLENLLPPHAKRVVAFRLPDHPTYHDMEAIGVGNSNPVEEEKNGIVCLDETALWLNARSWADKERQRLLDWFVHSRKYGWDVYFIAQSPAQVDKQLRDALTEFHVSCSRLDRIKIPFLPIRLPRLHIGTVRIGFSKEAVVADRWIYRGVDCFEGYDTCQRFSAFYSNGLYSYLTPWHLKGRYGVKQKVNKKLVIGLIIFGFICGAVVSTSFKSIIPDAKAKASEVVSKDITVRGVVYDGGSMRALLSNGKYIDPSSVKEEGGVTLYLYDNTWYKGQ